jgi:hypothetical protein
MDFSRFTLSRKPPSHSELLRVLAAIEKINDASLLGELQDRIAADIRLTTQEARSATPGRAMDLVYYLKQVFRVPEDLAEEAVEDYLRPSPSRTAIETTLQLAAEIEARRRPARQAESTVIGLQSRPSRPPAPQPKRRLVG